MGMDRRSFLTKGSALLAGALGGRLFKPLSAAAATSLFQDSFKRRGTSKGWGRPWFNQRRGLPWGIARKKAFYKIPAPQLGAGRHSPDPVIVLNHDVADVDVKARLSASNPKARFGVVARTVGYSNYYGAYLENQGAKGSFLHVSRFSLRDEKVLKSVSRAVAANTQYWVRLKVTGTNPVAIQAKAWEVGKAEPRAWAVSLSDTDPQRRIERPGAFGFLFAHDDNSRKAARFKAAQFSASSAEVKTKTPARVTFAFTGRTLPGATVGTYDTQAIAKTDIPATVRFHVSTSSRMRNATIVAPTKTFTQPLTARATFSGLDDGTTYYWRAVATAKSGRISRSSIRSFKTPLAPGTVSFAFASCSHSVSISKSFQTAAKLTPDFFVHLGDFGYAQNDKGGAAAAHSAPAYQDRWVRMLGRSQMQQLHKSSSFIMRQDDHDYGNNNCWKDTVRSFTKPAWDQMSANATSERYFDMRFGDVHCFFLECHAYSDDPLASGGPGGTILGAQQKAWLKSSMQASDASVLVVFSTLPFHGGGEGAGTWKKRFANEGDELKSFFFGLQGTSRRVIICSGNAHAQVLNQFQKSGSRDLFEFVSSGTDSFASTTGRPIPSDGTMMPDRAQKEAAGFGLVTVRWLGSSYEITFRSVSSQDPTKNVWQPLTITV